MNGKANWIVYRFGDVTENWREALGSLGLALVSGRVRKASKAGTYEGYDAKDAAKSYVSEIIPQAIKEQLSRDGLKVSVAKIPPNLRVQANLKVTMDLPPGTTQIGGEKVLFFRVFVEDIDE